MFRRVLFRSVYTAQTTIYQNGSIVEATVAEFLAAEEGDTQYRMTGVLQELYEYNGNVRGFYIRDYTGQTLVYSPAGFTTDVAKVGDIVTVIGKRSSYNGTPQMGSAQFEELVHSVIPVNIDEFLDKEDNPDVYYMISGTIIDIANPIYGNVTLDDGTNDVYVYGTYPGWGATGDNRKNWLETAGIELGDKLTVIGVRYTHNGNPQLSNGIYFSHEKAQ